MALIPTFSQQVVHSLFEVPPYDGAGVNELLLAVGRPDNSSPEAVAFALNEIVKTFTFDLWKEVQASTPEREREARRLADACSKVLAITGVAKGAGGLFAMFGRGGLFAAAALRGETQGEAATMNALKAVDLLRQDALKMLEIEGRRRRMKQPKAGRPESKAMRRMVRDLSVLYEEVWLKTPGISTGDKEEPCGPLMRLILDAVRRLRACGVRLSATPSSLRATWRRIPAEEKMPCTHLSGQIRQSQ